MIPTIYRLPRLRSPAPLLAALALLGLAGPPSAAEERRWPALFQDRAEVTVVNVEVFVSDSAGRPVTGLSRDDFRLFENGEEVEISNFYAVEGGLRRAPAVDAPAAAPAPAPERELRLVLLVDNESITAANRKRALQRLREFVLAHRRPGLKTMVASLERSGLMVIRQPFTETGHEVFVALDELEHVAAGSNVLEAERRNLVQEIERLNVKVGTPVAFATGGTRVEEATVHSVARSLLLRIQAYGEQRYGQSRQVLARMTQLLDALAPLPGRKSLVYVSDGLPTKAGEGLFEVFFRRLRWLDEVASDVSRQWETARHDLTPDLRELVARANAARTTLYSLDASPPASTRRGAAETVASRRTSSLESRDEIRAHDGLILMAESTGGRAGLSPAALAGTLEGVLADFDHHYSLGYTPPDDGEGWRTIEVEVPGRDVVVRWRRSVRVKSLDELVNERVLGTLLLGETVAADNPLEVSVDTAEITPRDDGTYLVPLLVEVPVGKLVLVPDKSAHQASVSMYVAARDAAGRVSEVTRHLCPIRVPNSELLVAYGRRMVCGLRLAMRGGEQGVAVAVRDEIANVVSVVRLDLDVPGDEHPAPDAPGP